MVDPPFFRFRLKAGNRPPFAAAHQAMNIGSEQWDELWDALEPLSKTIDRSQNILNGVMLVVLLVSLALVFAFGIPYANEHHLHSGLRMVLYTFALFAVLYPLFAFIGYVRQSNLKKYQQLVAQYSHAFHKCKVECRLLRSGISNTNTATNQPFLGGHFLYLIPVSSHDADAYVSMDATSESRMCGNQNAVSTLYQEDYVPSGLESIAVNDWNTFWRTLHEQSTNYVQRRRLFWVCFWVFWVTIQFYPSTSSIPLVLNLLFFLLIVGVSIAMCYYPSQLRRMEQEMEETIQSYQEIFASQRVYMEACRVEQLQWLCSGTEQRVLYFYPLQSNGENYP